MKVETEPPRLADRDVLPPMTPPGEVDVSSGSGPPPVGSMGAPHNGVILAPQIENLRPEAY